MAPEQLTEFMDEHADLRWSWGHCDCSLVLADWCMWLGYPDCAEHLRGSYRNEVECRELVEASGGLVAIVDDCMNGIGVSRAEEAVCGSIGVLGSARDTAKQWGALFDGESWMLRANDRFVKLTTREPLAIWTP